MQPSTIAILFIIFGIVVLILGLVIPRLDQKQSMSYTVDPRCSQCECAFADFPYYDQQSGKCMCVDDPNFPMRKYACCSTHNCQ